MNDVIASLLTSSGRAIEVNTVCKDCPSHPGLHVDRDRFIAYDTKLDHSEPRRETRKFLGGQTSICTK